MDDQKDVFKEAIFWILVESYQTLHSRARAMELVKSGTILRADKRKLGFIDALDFESIYDDHDSSEYRQAIMNDMKLLHFDIIGWTFDKFLEDDEFGEILDHKYTFPSDPKELEHRLNLIIGIVYTLREDIPQSVNLACMKALYEAGKVIKELEYCGKVRNVTPTKAGATPKKSRYTDQDIIESFHKCEANNLNAMAIDIEDLLTVLKKNTKSKKDVPSISTIKRVLKREGLDKKLKK